MKTAPAVVLVAACLLAAAPSAAQNDPSPRAALMARIAGRDPSPLFAAATPLLLDYLETIVSPEKRAPVYGARDRADLLTRIEAAAGKDLIDLGNEMFGYYESRASKEFNPAWVTFPAGAFLVHVHPGSAADRDRDLIGGEIRAVMIPSLQAFGLTETFAVAQGALKPPAPDAAGLIPIYLHAARTEPGAQTIAVESPGRATMGAAVIEKAGRLTFEAHVLYFNAIFLPVVEHEAAHAVVMLGTYDVAALPAKPLEGEADLDKAFFTGLRKIPMFLQEGLADWALYYHGFLHQWGLLPSPESLLARLRHEGRTMPLSKLLAGDIRNMGKNRKAYSLQAAAFLQYLLKTQGTDKVKHWLASNEANGTKTFAAAFGLDLADAENDFLASLEPSR
jgi:hypothetical protein